MKFELQEPFKSDWKYGYLYINPENRKTVTLYNSKEETSCISYARYIMTVDLGHYIGPDYEVDHVDNDKTNDDLDNLQLLTSEENKVKAHEYYINNIQITHDVKCCNCEKEFIITDRDFKAKKSQADKSNTQGNIFCSRSCSAKFYSEDTNSFIKNISDELKFRIRELRTQGRSSYKIAKQLNVSRNTVMKYWKNIN